MFLGSLRSQTTNPKPKTGRGELSASLPSVGSSQIAYLLVLDLLRLPVGFGIYHQRFIISLETNTTTTRAADNSSMICDCLTRMLLKW